MRTKVRVSVIMTEEGFVRPTEIHFSNGERYPITNVFSLKNMRTSKNSSNMLR